MGGLRQSVATRGSGARGGRADGLSRPGRALRRASARRRGPRPIHPSAPAPASSPLSSTTLCPPPPPPPLLASRGVERDGAVGKDAPAAPRRAAREHPAGQRLRRRRPDGATSGTGVSRHSVGSGCTRRGGRRGERRATVHRSRCLTIIDERAPVNDPRRTRAKSSGQQSFSGLAGGEKSVVSPPRLGLGRLKPHAAAPRRRPSPPHAGRGVSVSRLGASAGGRGRARRPSWLSPPPRPAMGPTTSRFGHRNMTRRV